MKSINKTYLGIEFGTTRIKTLAIDDNFRPISTGDFTWQSSLENGIWTYSIEEIWSGLKAAISGVTNRDSVCSVGIHLSAMMHGYFAFDKDWNLLVPFRTWQNTMTEEAASTLSALFGFNIPQRWSIAHLYQAILNGEEHVPQIAHITTLAGYVHYMLTGENIVGIGEGSGIFPVDTEKLCYDATMLAKFDNLVSEYDLPWNIRDVIPQFRLAGENAGYLTESRAALIDDLLPVGLPFCPCEGDAETGMVAFNAIAPGTGNISAGTSIFSMVVLERPLKKVYDEVGIVLTPHGKSVAMVHCSNCTADMNQWFKLFSQLLELFGTQVDKNELFTRLYLKSLEGQTDAGGLMLFNYVTGENILQLNEGRPMLIRSKGVELELADFLRAQIYSAMVTLSYGMRLLEGEDVRISSLIAHGGLLKTRGVAQKYLAAACNAPVTCMETAGEGGPYGMALLAAFANHKEGSLEDFLNNSVFVGCKAVTVPPDIDDLMGFRTYLERFATCLPLEKAAVEIL